MRRIWLIAALTVVSAGCRAYDLRSSLLNQSGLMPASRVGRYGGEQAEAMAIGRALGQWDGGPSVAARVIQATKAAEYARSLPGVRSVIADTLGYRLTVTFKSGWRATILPVQDGVKPEETPGLPKA